MTIQHLPVSQVTLLKNQWWTLLTISMQIILAMTKVIYWLVLTTKLLEDREIQFVYRCSLLSNTEFIRKQKQILSTTSNMDCQLLRQKFRQKFSVMKKKKNEFSRRIVCFDILIHVLSWRLQILSRTTSFLY